MTEERAETRTIELLQEIRDDQRRLIERYESVAGQALELQRRALERVEESVALQKEAVNNQRQAIATQAESVTMQAGFGRLYRRVLVVALVMVAALIALLLWAVGPP